MKSVRYHEIELILKMPERSMDDHTTQELQQQVFIWVCTWLLGAFSDILAFGSVKIVKIEFFIKGA